MMTGPVLRAGAWPAVAGLTGVAVVAGGCGAAFPAAATMLLPVSFTLLAAAAAFTLDEPASAVVDVTPACRDGRPAGRARRRPSRPLTARTRNHPDRPAPGCRTWSGLKGRRVAPPLGDGNPGGCISRPGVTGSGTKSAQLRPGTPLSKDTIRGSAPRMTIQAMHQPQRAETGRPRRAADQARPVNPLSVTER
jgi:hypothetical protein